MRTIPVDVCTDSKKGIYETRYETVYDVNDFPYLIPFETKMCTKREQGKTVEYYNIPCAYDIETTTIDKVGFMYHWQFCVDDKVCFGRTWDEFMAFIQKLVDVNELSDTKRLAVYVHALDFEFTFSYQFLQIDKAFFKDKHKPLYVRDVRGLEFRCSYFLSNMSLKKFCESSEGCVHFKLSGDIYDYKVIRYPDSVMKLYELAYCYNDVRGLCECIWALLKEDTIVSIPLTSTGFVRRDVLRAMKANKKNWFQFQKLRLSADLYQFCVDCSRGGNAHANRWLAGLKLGTKHKPVYSYDIKSSYPARALLGYYPVGVFTAIVPRDKKEFNQYLSRYCCLIEVTFYKIWCLDSTPIPYIPLDKCKEISEDVQCDNGRVLSASLITMRITEMDFEIIRNTYTLENGYEIKQMYVSKRGELPHELRQCVWDYFHAKCTLEDVDYYLYTKSKNKLNGIYGMMLSALVHNIISFNQDVVDAKKIWHTDTPNMEEALLKYYNNHNNILTYQHGLYIVTAARYELQIMLDRVGEWCIYCDTDSIKFLGAHNIAKFEQRNNEIMKEQIAYAEIPPIVEYNGNEYIMGLWNRERDMYNFKTLGSKKYCYNYVDNDEYVITVAGMSKELGAKAIKNADNFFIGATYHNVGRTVSYYNYEPAHYAEINGHRFLTASNIGVEDTTYTLGVTGEYYELIGENAQIGIDTSYN